GVVKVSIAHLDRKGSKKLTPDEVGNVVHLGNHSFSRTATRRPNAQTLSTPMADTAAKLKLDTGEPPALALEPRILDKMAADLERAGLVGATRAAKLVYLVFTSRYLARPLSAYIRAQSGAGKSYLVDRVMKLFPATAYHYRTSITPKALAY